MREKDRQSPCIPCYAPKVVAGTTAIVVVFSSATGFLGHVSLGGLDPRFLAVTGTAAVIGALLYSLNVALGAQWVLGQVCFSAYVWAPLLVLACLRLSQRFWAGAAAGAVAGLMVHYGVHYFVVYVLLLCGLLTVALACQQRAWRALGRFGGLFLLSFLFVAGVRLLPMLAVIHDFPRLMAPPFALDGNALWHMFFVPSLGPVRVVLRIFVGQTGYQLTSMETASYVGVVTLGLALYSLRRGVRFFHLGALLSFLLLLGNYQPWHLSRWLSQLPPFDSMWVVTRWRLVVVACVGFAAAAALDAILQWAQTGGPPRRRLVALLAWAAPVEIVALLLPSWAATVAPYRDRPVSRAELHLPQTPALIALQGLRQRSQQARIFFSLFRSNIGAAEGYDPLFGYRPAASARTYVGHPRYRGEAVVAGRAVEPQLWSPNRLRFAGLPPGQMLELNLNPGRGWRLNGSPLFGGHRTFELASPFLVRVPQTGVVDLRYTPPGLHGGALLSLLGGLGLLGCWMVRRTLGRRASGR